MCAIWGNRKNRQAVGTKDSVALVVIPSAQLLIEQFIHDFGRFSGYAFD